MLKISHLPRILGLLAGIACMCATVALASQAAPQKQQTGNAAPDDSSGVIVLDISPEKGKGQLPPVVFDHTLHTKGDVAGETCASCHDAGSFAFKGTQGKKGGALENAYHDSCVSCHAERLAKKMSTGPQKAECRSCHNAQALASAKPVRVDGGMDAGIHARHVESDGIFIADGKENCIVCHHKTPQPVSGDVKADSCRSCHKPMTEKNTPANGKSFGQVAHTACITCHLNLMNLPTGDGKAEKLPVTCAACHNAEAKAAYKRPERLPRLDAGQPDSTVMGLDVIALPHDAQRLPSGQKTTPDTALDIAVKPQSSMPPVVFDHKKHEAFTANCTTCHHNTMQKCSSCHTLSGSSKGGNLTLAQAMHTPTSERSCVGCHEMRKTATPECAGCHAIMPKRKDAQPNCSGCHVPPPDRKQSQQSARPFASDIDKNIQAALAAAPEKVTIGVLSDEFEPSTFPHRAIIKHMIEGIEKTSPGMMAFHADPYTLCASCHHMSPPSATPPSCASCHAKNTGSAKATPAPDGRPMLKEAYHQQCMGCHTAMKIEKPANTDCASCHAKRAPKREGGR